MPKGSNENSSALPEKSLSRNISKRSSAWVSGTDSYTKGKSKTSYYESEGDSYYSYDKYPGEGRQDKGPNYRRIACVRYVRPIVQQPAAPCCEPCYRYPPQCDPYCNPRDPNLAPIVITSNPRAYYRPYRGGEDYIQNDPSRWKRQMYHGEPLQRGGNYSSRGPSHHRSSYDSSYSSSKKSSRESEDTERTKALIMKRYIRQSAQQGASSRRKSSSESNDYNLQPQRNRHQHNHPSKKHSMAKLLHHRHDRSTSNKRPSHKHPHHDHLSSNAKHHQHHPTSSKHPQHHKHPEPSKSSVQNHVPIEKQSPKSQQSSVDSLSKLDSDSSSSGNSASDSITLKESKKLYNLKVLDSIGARESMELEQLKRRQSSVAQIQPVPNSSNEDNPSDLVLKITEDDDVDKVPEIEQTKPLNTKNSFMSVVAGKKYLDKWLGDALK